MLWHDFTTAFQAVTYVNIIGMSVALSGFDSKVVNTKKLQAAITDTLVSVIAFSDTSHQVLYPDS